MPRPPRRTEHVLTFVTPAVLETIDARAVELRISRSELARTAITEYLKRHKKTIESR